MQEERRIGRVFAIHICSVASRAIPPRCAVLGRSLYACVVLLPTDLIATLARDADSFIASFIPTLLLPRLAIGTNVAL